MKKFLVVLLACALIFGFAATASAADTQIKEFSDIADQSQAAQNAIMKLAILGVVEGNEGIGGSFRPADNLTRAEFAKIVCYLTGNVKAAESLANVGSKFSDVSTGNWYTGWVNMAAQSGYFVGDPGGTFRPNANITMNEVVTVALRAAGYTDKLPGTWPANYALKAQNVGLLDDVTFVGSAAATRADMALICNETLGINMVVHISNEIAFALALSDGTVDPDGFSETYYVSNEQDLKRKETILHKAFDGVYYYVQANQTVLREGDITEPEAGYFDESNGWDYEDYDSGEITINILGSWSYEDDDFDDIVTNDNDRDIEYNVADSLASIYHLAGDYELADLSGMQVQVLVIDGKEINYVEPYSSYVLAKSIYRNSASNIVADGKTYRASSTMNVGGNVTNSETVAGNIYIGDTKGVDDLSLYSTFGGDAIQRLYNSDSDNDFPGKIYLDKDGRVYAVKNYNAYNEIPFGIVEELDNEVVLKAQTSNWKTTGSVGGNTNYTLDTDEPYVLYKDGQLIDVEDLEENDVITYLGDNGGHFYVVTSPAEGELTQQTSSKLTVSGYGYRQVTGFFLSDDGGEDFDAYQYSAANPIDTASFGEVEFATSYNFSRLDYVTLNTTANKVIGVVTNADPDSVYTSSGSTFDPQFKKLTIYNAEGKEVTYTFTTNFRNAYNYELYIKGYVPNAQYSSSSSALGKWNSDYIGAKTLETLATYSREIREGDIVQLTLDSSDNIKKISNYVAFDEGAASDKVEAVVKASNNRITITKNTLNTENGTYTLPTDATVFNVTVDGGEYDDVEIKTVASTLSADFKAMKIVAFDTKTNGTINALYIQEGVSAYKFGIISGQGRDATDDYYTINGSRVYGGERDRTTLPELVAYQISGGDASVTHLLAWVVKNGPVTYLTDMHAIVKGLDSDYGAAVGIVNSYSSSTNALNVNGTLLYVSSDTFLYDFVNDDDLSSASSLRDKFVAVIYNDDFDAISVALLSEEQDANGVWKNLAGQDPAAPSSDATIATVAGSSVTWPTGTGVDYDPYVDAINMPLGTGTFTRSNISLSTGATFTLHAVSFTGAAVDFVTVPDGAITPVYIIVTAADGTVAYYQLNVTIAVSSQVVTVNKVLTATGSPITPTVGGTGTFTNPYTITSITVPYSTSVVTNGDITPTVAGSIVTFYADDRFLSTVSSVALPNTGAVTNAVSFTVTSTDGSVTRAYVATVTRTAGSALKAITTDTKVMGENIVNSSSTAWTVTLPYGKTLADLTANDVVPGGVSTDAAVGTITISGNVISIPVTAENGTSNTHTITVSVLSASPALSQTIVPTVGTAAGKTTLTFTALAAGNTYALNPTANAGATPPAIDATTPGAYSQTLTSASEYSLGVGTFDVVEVNGGKVVGFGTVTITADEVFVTEIAAVAITGTAKPVGAALPANGTTSTPGVTIVPPVQWRTQNGTWGEITATTAFVAGVVYETKYEFTAQANYVFDSALESTGVTVAGVSNAGDGTVNTTVSTDGKTMTVVVTWAGAGAP